MFDLNRNDFSRILDIMQSSRTLQQYGRDRRFKYYRENDSELDNYEKRDIRKAKKKMKAFAFNPTHEGAPYMDILCFALPTLVEEFLKESRVLYLEDWWRGKIPTTGFAYLLVHLAFPVGITYSSANGSSYDKRDITGTNQYPYVPANYWAVKNIIMNETYRSGKKFIDIGAGIGTIPMLVAYFTEMECHGVEYDYCNIAIGKNNIPTFLNVKLKTKDAFKCEFSEFDRIYTWNPISDFDGCMKLFRHIGKSLKYGTLWYEYGGGPLDKVPNMVKAKCSVRDNEYGRSMYIITPKKKRKKPTKMKKKNTTKKKKEVKKKK